MNKFLLLCIFLILFSCSNKLSVFEYVADGDIEKVKMYLEENKNIRIMHNGNNLFVNAIDSGNLEMVQLLYNKGLDLKNKCSMYDYGGTNPLYRAVMKNRVDIVDFILKQGNAIKWNDRYTVLDLPDANGLKVYDFIRSKEMSRVFMDNNYYKKSTIKPKLDLLKINEKEYRILMNYFFGKDQDIQVIKQLFHNRSFEDFFKQNYINILYYSFFNTKDFYLNQKNIEALLTEYDVTRYLLDETANIFAVTIGSALQNRQMDFNETKVLLFLGHQVFIFTKLAIKKNKPQKLNINKMELHKYDWLKEMEKEISVIATGIHEKFKKKVLPELLKNNDTRQKYFYDFNIETINYLKNIKVKTYVAQHTYVVLLFNNFMLYF